MDIDYNKKTVKIAGQTFPMKARIISALTVLPARSTAEKSRRGHPAWSYGLLFGDKAAAKTEKFQAFKQLMDWCAKVTRMAVRTNADNPEQTEQAIAFSAGYRSDTNRAYVLRRRSHRRCA